MTKTFKISLYILCSILLLLISFFAVFKSYTFFWQKYYPIKYSHIINVESNKFNLEPTLVYSVMRVESGFDPNITSDVGAVGLMQLMPSTFEWLQEKEKLSNTFGEDDLKNEEVNIHYGCYYLKYLLDKYNDNEILALCAYNAGIGNVEKWLNNSEYSKDGINLDYIPFGETDRYVINVLKGKEIYYKLYFEKEELYE